MRVHLLDGTYELFRHHFGSAARHEDPGPFAATVGVLSSVLQLLQEGATHVGVASDHVIESFRNDLWPGYKTSAGMPPELLAQTPVVEDGARGHGRHDLGDGRVRGRRRARQRRRGRRRRRARRRRGHLHAGQGPRTVREGPARWSSSTGARASCSTRRASSPSSVSRPPRSPTTSRSSATRPTASPASPAGGPRAPPPCWPATGTWRTSPAPAGSVGRPGPARRGQAVRHPPGPARAGLPLPPHRHPRARRPGRQGRRLALDRPDRALRRGGRAHRRAPPPRPGPADGGRRAGRTRRRPPAEVTARRPAAPGRHR